MAPLWEGCCSHERYMHAERLGLRCRDRWKGGCMHAPDLIAGRPPPPRRVSARCHRAPNSRHFLSSWAWSTPCDSFCTPSRHRVPTGGTRYFCDAYGKRAIKIIRPDCVVPSSPHTYNLLYSRVSWGPGGEVPEGIDAINLWSGTSSFRIYNFLLNILH